MKAMKCSKVRKLLSRFLDNELSGTVSEAVMRHLETCPDCRNEFNLLQTDQKLLKPLTVPEISPYFTARTLARIRTLKPAPVLPRLLWQTAVSLLILAGIGLGIMLGSGLATGNSTGSELAALNAEPSIEELFTPGNGGR